MNEQQQNTVANKSGVSKGGYKPGSVVLMLAGLYVTGFVVIIWLTMPEYVELYYGIDATEAALVTDELQNARISYHFEPSSGTLMVQSKQYDIAKNLLEEKGLLNRSSFVDDLAYGGVSRIQRSTSNGQTFHQQALESELAKSIASIDNVQSARVHLALSPTNDKDINQSSRASVIVRLYPGRRLSETQISSISHLVAASTANLSLDRITIIDQSGQLLKPTDTSNVTSLSTVQFGYLRRLEQSYIDRIEDILTPVLGLHSLRTQVVADVDFQTIAPESMENAQVSLTTVKSGTIRRLAVTVIVDNKPVEDDDGNVIRISRDNEEMQRIAELIKQAIGFKAERGDTVTVLNEPLNVLSNRHIPVTVSVWEHIQHKNSLWYLVLGCIALIIIGLTMRILRAGTKGGVASPSTALATGIQFGNDASADGHADMNTAQESIKQELTFEQQLLKARQLAREEPKIVVQLVRSWMKEND